MYAVVKTGGKQYKVAIGQKLKVEQITADVDSQIVLEEVLMVADGEAVKIGAPVVAGASIKATVVLMVVATRLPSSRCVAVSTTCVVLVIARTTPKSVSTLSSLN